MKKSRSDHPDWVIAVGSSAGGLEALGLLLSRLSDNVSAPIIIAQHLSPRSKSVLAELLGKKTDRHVLVAKNGQHLESREILVIPPNFDLTFEGRRIVLTEASSDIRPKPSIDTLFHSLAENFGDRAIGIILSGTGSDGSEGIRSIHAAGGITVAQTSESAKYDGMPNAAIDTGAVDCILSPDRISEYLPLLIEKHLRATPSGPEQRNQNARDIQSILVYLKSERGTDFTDYKPATIQRRIEKRMALLGIQTVSDYFEVLKLRANEKEELAQEMLISVTSFFRDKEAFDILRAHLTQLITQRSYSQTDELRVWIAGCATGEEAYSLCFLALDIMQSLGKDIPLRIFATDLDHDAILHARSGLYSLHDVAHLPDGYVKKFFDQRADNFDVKKSVRDCIIFARQDLIQHPPFVKLDLISCRNVLIYFNQKLQDKIFSLFHYALRPGGLLFLGKSESLPQNSEFFTTIDRNARIFQRINSAPRLVVQSGNRLRDADVSRTHLSPSMSQIKLQRTNAEHQAHDVALREFLKAFDLSGVLIDFEGTVLQVFGDTTAVLKLPSGMADLKLTNLLPQRVAIEFPILLTKAQREKNAAKGRPHRVPIGKSIQSLTLQVRPLSGLDSRGANAMLVTFELRPIAKAKVGIHPRPEIGSTEETQSLIARITELETELAGAKESLQTAVEELSVSNEELQSANEEMASTNEELQASNEELETTNEELQSTNEELTTLNEELNVKSGEVRLMNASLENVQSSIGSPLIVVDNNLRIQRFNNLAQRIFDISKSHIGLSIIRVSCHCEIPDFETKILHTLKTGEISESIVEGSRTFYQLRILPCQDDLGKNIGAILIFFDNTKIIQTEAKLQASQSKLQSILDGSPALIALKDTLGRYLVANKAFLQVFSLTESQIIGKTDREILPESVANTFRDADLEVLLKRETNVTQERIRLKSDRQLVLLSNRFPLFEDGVNRSPYALGIVSVDVSKQVEIQEQLEESESRYKTVVEDQAVFVCRYRPDGTLTFVNSAFVNYFGGTVPSNLGHSLYRFMTAEEAKLNQDLLLTLHPTQPVSQFEHRFRQHNQQSNVHWIQRGIFSTDGKLVEVQAVGFDFTEMKVQTRQLGEREKLYGSILGFTSDFLMVYRVTNGDFILELLNKSAENSLAQTNQDFIGKHLKDMVEPALYREISERYTRALATRCPVSFEETISLPSGVKHFFTTLVPIMTPGSETVERVAALSRDVSHYKQIETELRVEKRNAESANQAKSDFLASMSHELRTPLNVILGMSELLIGTDLNSDQKHYLDGVQRSGKMLLSLIDDVLDLSKIESGKLALERRPFSLGNMCQEVLLAFENQAKTKNLQLTLTSNLDPLTMVQGDEARVRQVLVNFVSNALKFTKQGQVGIHVLEQDEPNRLVSNFRIEVTDSGIGIPQHLHKKLFTRFSQADTGHARKFGGSGLGLAISKQLIELMGGNIGFSSVDGQGSCFWFTLQLPIYKTAHPKSDGAATSAAATPGRSNARQPHLRILAVDDNLDSLSLLKAFLRRLGHSAELASTGQDAIQKMQSAVENPELGPPFDLVFMDMQMPEMDGLEATKLIRSLGEPFTTTPIVALTANALKGQDQECFDAGMNDYVTKPVSFASLTAIIDKWSARNSAAT